MNNESEYDSDYSDYDEESFDNESIEEVSELEESISNFGQSREDHDNIKSLTISIDKLSCEEEDNGVSNLNSENDDDAISEPIEKYNEYNKTVNYSYGKTPAEKDNVHEIDESDSDEVTDVEIGIQIDNNISEQIPPVADNIKSNEKEDDNETSCNQSEIEFHVSSQTPTSFNSENHAFHMDIIEKPTRSNTNIQQRSKNANRKSLSFTNERMREIERHNQILLRKILTQKPRKEMLSHPNVRVTSAAVNRKKQQRQIDLDNQVLKRKIEAISLRRRQNIYHQ